jgi:hypothetical protein
VVLALKSSIKVWLLGIGLLAMVPNSAFALVIELNPELRMTNDYTDNVDLTENDQTSSLVTVISPGVTATITGEQGIATLGYRLGYSIYSKSSAKNAFRQRLELAGESDLSKRTHVSFTDSLIQTEEPTSVDDPVENRNRETLIRNNANLSLSHRFGRYDSIQLLYGHSLIESDDEETESSTAHMPAINFIHRFDPYRIDLETGIAYTHGRFEGDSPDVETWQITAGLSRMFTKLFRAFLNYRQTLTRYQGDREDYSIYGLSAGFDTRISKTMNLLAEAGYYIQSIEEGTDRSDVTASITATKTFKYATIGLNGSTGYRQSFFEGENLGFSSYYQIDGEVRYQFTRYLDAGLTGYYRLDEYRETTPERTDETVGAVADLSWQIEEPLFLNLDVRYQTVESDDPTESEDAYGIGSGLVYEWTKWLSLSFGVYHRRVAAEENDDNYQENRVTFELRITPSRPIRTIH